MKRYLLKLCVLIFAGAIVNVAVAWGCPRLWSPDWMSQQWSQEESMRYWSCPCARYAEGTVLADLRGGWPMHCLDASWLGSWRNAKAVFNVPGTEVDSELAERIVDPLHFLWPGFVINTIFYAAVFWILLATPNAVRRRWRSRRRLCPGCGYPVGASEVCTECGEAVKAR